MLLKQSLRQFTQIKTTADSPIIVFDSTTRGTTNIDKVVIKTVLIIATVPYSADHVMALWTQLECVTGGIDRVLISAPDTSWSKGIISLVIDRFERLSKTMTFSLEASFYVNNRYDVGLWCDGLDYVNDRYETNVSRAIFLINDSVSALRPYASLTDRTVHATHIELLQRRGGNNTGRGTLKLIGLNGELPRENKHYWVQSVYRGLTPDGSSIFHQHSCADDARGKCSGKKRADDVKRCIVNKYEMNLSRLFRQEEVGAMYPNNFLDSMDASSWEAKANNRRIWPREPWLRGRQYFWYLHDVHDFPFRKLKWSTTGPPPPSESRCLTFLDGGKAQFFDEMPYPSKDILEAYKAEMLESDPIIRYAR